jgi:exonuclease SbcC
METRAARLTAAKEQADQRIASARELGRRAREARTNIVRRVFNDSLNTVWRDLFVRLAPDEPFVPAFALPENQGGPVEAVLETLYRSGGKGGNPRAMLSAGNLNTAALTLFLALHLSVGPTLPWLVIDDPVQSMDEVHIAQFAALLRTLSKQHGRQVIIAVHEKPLFDYLTLELSPAFQDDRLITIEMGRTASGVTVLKYEPMIWKPDTAIAA